MYKLFDDNNKFTNEFRSFPKALKTASEEIFSAQSAIDNFINNLNEYDRHQLQVIKQKRKESRNLFFQKVKNIFTKHKYEKGIVKSFKHNIKRFSPIIFLSRIKHKRNTSQKNDFGMEM